MYKMEKKDTTQKLFSLTIGEIIGWLGALLLLAAFILQYLQVIRLDGFLYILMNLGGSLGIIWISLKRRAYPPAIVNGIWFLFSLYELIVHLLK